MEDLTKDPGSPGCQSQQRDCMMIKKISYALLFVLFSHIWVGVSVAAGLSTRVSIGGTQCNGSDTGTSFAQIPSCNWAGEKPFDRHLAASGVAFASYGSLGIGLAGSIATSSAPQGGVATNGSAGATTTDRLTLIAPPESAIAELELSFELSSSQTIVTQGDWWDNQNPSVRLSVKVNNEVIYRNVVTRLTGPNDPNDITPIRPYAVRIGVPAGGVVHHSLRIEMYGGYSCLMLAQSQKETSCTAVLSAAETLTVTGAKALDANGDEVPGATIISESGFDYQNGVITDTDDDGVPDVEDNCPNDVNPDQMDNDLDSMGDACDDDDDNDGVNDDPDNCPLVANPDQTDTDGDFDGNACDTDDDDDGVVDEIDNCPLIINPDQDDFDADGAGDLCDTDADNDDVLDAVDACLFTPAAAIINTNGCAIADLCPCIHPDGTDKWKNHGKYVSCVAHAANDFRDAGLINYSEHSDIVSEAAQAACGVKD